MAPPKSSVRLQSGAGSVVPSSETAGRLLGLAPPGPETVAVSRPEPAADASAIAELVAVFFAAFTSGPDCVERIDDLRAAFLPGAVIVRTCGFEPAVYDVEGFLAPRQELLTGGTLTGFREWEISGRTDIWGDIAQHVGGYAKAGVQDGVPISGRGLKTLQFVRTPAGWRIAAAAWDDERDGLTLPPAWTG